VCQQQQQQQQQWMSNERIALNMMYYRKRKCAEKL